jgi:2-oxoglutarate ferredoxin oxidoreductase subunit delta
MSEQQTALPSEAPPKTAGSRKVRGVVYVNPNRCKGCGFCIAFCPQDVLQFAAEFTPQGYHPPHLVDLDGCTGCDLCGLYCPDFAIYSVMLKHSPKAAGEPALADKERLR